MAARSRGSSAAPSRVALRAARPIDYSFARQLYAVTMRGLVEQAFGWDEYRQEMALAGQFDQSEVRIITLDGRDVGWVQLQAEDSALNLGQFYIAPEQQSRGIGSIVLRRLLARSRREGKAMTLAVMKGNPAIRLYRRHGFRYTHEDRYKIYMRAEP